MLACFKPDIDFVQLLDWLERDTIHLVLLQEEVRACQLFVGVWFDLVNDLSRQVVTALLELLFDVFKFILVILLKHLLCEFVKLCCKCTHDTIVS